MWPLYQLKNEIVGVSLQPDALVCSWITPAHKKYTLKAYQRIPLTNFSYTDGILFNPCAIGSAITSFLEQNFLRNSFIAVSATGCHITEFVLDMPNGSPAQTDFPLQKLNKLIWDYRYLYPKENGHYAMYICGISRQVLAQYQLLAITNHLNLIVLTTEFTTHMEVYKHLYGTAFRRAQLARDMQIHNHQLLNILHVETLHRILTIDPSVSIVLDQEKPWLFSALGLFLAGRNMA